MRQLLVDNTELRLEISQIKSTVEKIAVKQKGHDQNIELLFEYIDRLQEKQATSSPKERKRIGYEVGGSK